MLVERVHGDCDDLAARTGQGFVLRPLDDGGECVRFALLEGDAAPSPGAERFELVVDTRGHLRAAPGYAIWAEWEIPRGDQQRFIDTAAGIFDVRREAIPGFGLDWLLRRSDRDERFLVVGLYADEDGARVQSLQHPVVAAVLAQHRLDYAKNVSGFPVFSVVRYALAEVEAPLPGS